MKNRECNIENGTCSVNSPDSAQSARALPDAGPALIYVGDPMCSWCWGIAPALRQLQQFCGQRQLPLRVVVGGLRADGGDPWTGQFRQFLAHHWQQIATLTGQPFSFRLLDWESFDYDTEPACRAVVTARILLDGDVLEFFSAVQRKFYVANKDPKQIDFYRSICADAGLDFVEFARRFESDDVRARTRDDFQLSRNWGVSGFPTIILRTREELIPVTTGYSTFDKMREIVGNLVPGPV
jgi:putative protein-disulfide isomerase